MIIAFLRGSRFFRSLVLTSAVFSLLLWLYIVLRIVFNHVRLDAPFIYDFPLVSFWVLGAMAFAFSFLCTLLYLWLWGRFDRTSTVPRNLEERGP